MSCLAVDYFEIPTGNVLTTLLRHEPQRILIHQNDLTPHRIPVKHFLNLLLFLNFLSISMITIAMHHVFLAYPNDNVN